MAVHIYYSVSPHDELSDRMRCLSRNEMKDLRYFLSALYIDIMDFSPLAIMGSWANLFEYQCVNDKSCPKANQMILQNLSFLIAHTT